MENLGIQGDLEISDAEIKTFQGTINCAAEVVKTLHKEWVEKYPKVDFFGNLRCGFPVGNDRTYGIKYFLEGFRCKSANLILYDRRVSYDNEKADSIELITFPRKRELPTLEDVLCNTRKQLEKEMRRDQKMIDILKEIDMPLQVRAYDVIEVENRDKENERRKIRRQYELDLFENDYLKGELTGSWFQGHYHILPACETFLIQKIGAYREKFKDIKSEKDRVKAIRDFFAEYSGIHVYEEYSDKLPQTIFLTPENINVEKAKELLMQQPLNPKDE